MLKICVEVFPYIRVQDEISTPSYLLVYCYCYLKPLEFWYTLSKVGKRECLFTKLSSYYQFVNEIRCLNTFNEIIY